MMELVYLSRNDIKNCHFLPINKILLNICDYINYGLTDTNQFYRNYYSRPKDDYENYKSKLSTPYIKSGTVIYSRLFSYFTIANIVCVRFPKTSYNLIPFDYEGFKNALFNVKQYVSEHEIKELHSIVFGTKTIEGNWSKIIDIMNDIFKDNNLKFVIYGKKNNN